MTPSARTTRRAVLRWITSLFAAAGLLVAPAVSFGQVGTTWASQTSAADNAWMSVAHGNGLFVAVSQDGTDRVMTSPDGVAWTSRNAASASTWQSVTYGNGTFVAVATGGANQVMTSTDGITWTGRTAANTNLWQSVTYGGGLFVAVAQTGTISNNVMTSPDGITWTSRSAAAENRWQAAAYGSGVFVAVSRTGIGNRVMTSGVPVPAPAPTPATPTATPTLGATVLVPRARLVSGQEATIGIRVRNTGTTAATSVSSCLRLPVNLAITRAPGAVRSGRTVCFRVGDVAAGSQVTRVVTVRALSVRKVTRRVIGSVRASGVALTAVDPVSVSITPRVVRPRVVG